MPGFDGTGPDFEGPMTGGARGRCTADGSFAGRPMGYGRGYGRGRRRGAPPVPRRGSGRVQAADPSLPSNTATLAELERQAARMRQQLDAVHRRIDSLKTEPTDIGPSTSDL